MNHGSARKEKGEARERKRTGSGEKREKKRKGERMRGIALERIFDFALLHPCFWEISASSDPLKKAKFGIV